MWFELAVPFADCPPQGFTQDWLLDSQLLGDARGPFGTQESIRYPLNVGEKEVYGAQLFFGAGNAQTLSTGDEIVQIRRGRLQQSAIVFRTVTLNEAIGILTAGKRKDA